MIQAKLDTFLKLDSSCYNLPNRPKAAGPGGRQRKAATAARNACSLRGQDTGKRSRQQHPKVPEPSTRSPRGPTEHPKPRGSSRCRPPLLLRLPAGWEHRTGANARCWSRLARSPAQPGTTVPAALEGSALPPAQGPQLPIPTRRRGTHLQAQIPTFPSSTSGSVIRQKALCLPILLLPPSVLEGCSQKVGDAQRLLGCSVGGSLQPHTPMRT